MKILQIPTNEVVGTSDSETPPSTSNTLRHIHLREHQGIYNCLDATPVPGITRTGQPQRPDVDRNKYPQASTDSRTCLDTRLWNVGAATPSGICESDSTGKARHSPQLTYRNTASMVSHIPLRPASGCVSSASNPSESHQNSEPRITPLFGTKRDRSGRAVSQARSHGHRDHPSFLNPSNVLNKGSLFTSDSELESHSSSCGCDTDEDLDSEDEAVVCEYSVIEEYTLPENHPFQSVRSSMLEHLSEKIQAWRTTARYVMPPNDGNQLRKRAGVTFGQGQSARFREKEDGPDPQLVVISRPDGYFHLACPFYISNPTRYQQCLLHEDLRRIEEVIRHLQRYHKQPPYCPICRQTFNDGVECETHIQARTCELRSRDKIDGLTRYALFNLMRKDRMYLSESKRWQRIWAAVSSSASSRQSAYLRDGVGLVVTMVRDYWARYGRERVAEYLASCGLLVRQHEDEEMALEALHRQTLDDLLRKVLENDGGV